MHICKQIVPLRERLSLNRQKSKYTKKIVEILYFNMQDKMFFFDRLNSQLAKKHLM